MKDGALAFIKIIFFLLFIPLLIAVTLAFQTQVLNVPTSKEAYLLWGVVIYVAMNFFLYNFKEVYGWGRALITKLFGFSAQLGEILSFIVPIYTVLVLLIYLLLVVLDRGQQFESLALLLVGFTLAMHLVMTAKEIFETDNSPLKAQYLFGFSLIYVLNLIVASLLLAWIINEYSLISFFKSLAHHTTALYKEVYRFLFIPQS